MNNFIYHNPTKIIFGKDQIQSLHDELTPYEGKRILFVYGKSSIKTLGIYDTVITTLKALNIKVFEVSGVRPNPSMKSVMQGRKLLVEENIDFILAAGGGSVVDAAKAMAFSPFVKANEVWDVFLRKIRPKKAIPLGVILTLAATGTEANGNTVITNDDTHEKRSCAFPFLHPKFSIIDPSYTQSVDEHFAIAGCLDITMHVFEQYFSNTERTETADYLSMGILKSVIENTERLRKGQDSYQTRANISWAATIGLCWILAQGKIGDWATHLLSYPITETYGITHGYALSMIYPAWLTVALRHNKKTMEQRLSFLGKEVFGIDDPVKVIAEVKKLYKSWGAPVSFKDANLTPTTPQLKTLADTALKLGTIGTVIDIDETIALEIYEQALV